MTPVLFTVTEPVVLFVAIPGPVGVNDVTPILVTVTVLFSDPVPDTVIELSDT